MQENLAVDPGASDPATTVPPDGDRSAGQLVGPPVSPSVAASGWPEPPPAPPASLVPAAPEDPPMPEPLEPAVPLELPPFPAAPVLPPVPAVPLTELPAPPSTFDEPPAPAPPDPFGVRSSTPTRALHAPIIGMARTPAASAPA